MQAERDSDLRKKKGERGLVVDQGLLLLENQEAEKRSTEEANKRRKLLEEVKDLDKDDEESEASEDEGENGRKDLKGKGKATEGDEDKESEEEDDSDDDDDDDDDEDETAELLRELEKIKKERAEEKERQVRTRTSLLYTLQLSAEVVVGFVVQELERAATEQTSREEEIATGKQVPLSLSPSRSPLLSLTSLPLDQSAPEPTSSARSLTINHVYSISKREW